MPASGPCSTSGAHEWRRACLRSRYPCSRSDPRPFGPFHCRGSRAPLQASGSRAGLPVLFTRRVGIGCLRTSPSALALLARRGADPKARRVLRTVVAEKGRTGSAHGAIARCFGCGTFSELRCCFLTNIGYAQSKRECGARKPGIAAPRLRSPRTDDGGARGLGRGRSLEHSRNATWLILPVVICLSQRLSHACVSMNKFRL